MRRLALATTLILTACLPLTALAADTTASPTPTPTVSVALSAAAGPSTTPVPVPITSLTKAAQAARLATLQSRGNAEITRRLTNLQTADTSVDSDTKLTGTDRTTLVNAISVEISGLTQLRQTLAAETTLAAARVDVQNIFLDYRVYALLLPQMRLVETADAESTALQKLQTYEGLLAQKVSSSNASLTDMQAKLQAASTLLNGFVSGVINLQPSDYNSDHTILTGKRATLVQVRTDLGAAVTDAQTIRQSLK